MNQWMDPQQWMGHFTDTASKTVESFTGGMKMWNDQVNQALDFARKTINTAMDNIKVANDQVFQVWESSVNQMKETHHTPTISTPTEKPKK